jgi:hypothetical protein
MKIPMPIRWSLLTGMLAGGVALGCNDGDALPEAVYTNIVDTATIYALRGTAVTLPSGYDIPAKILVRTDVAPFDFAFDISTAGEAFVYPAGALRLPVEPAIRKSTQSFESILIAPEDNFITEAPVAIAPGTVFIARSRMYFSGCELIGQLPRYAKFRVLAIDFTARSVTMETLVNQNCGYRGLEPGIPTT